jgi:hypothetical protein
MKVRVSFVVALLMVASSVAYSQDVAGMWKGKGAGFGGPPMEITLVITVEGNTVTGTWKQGEQEATKVTGVIEKGMLKFKRVRDRITFNYTGKIEGDQMTLTEIVEIEGRTVRPVPVGPRPGAAGGGGGAPLVLTRQ